MYFVLDLVCAGIIIGALIRYWSHALSHVLLKCLCVLISVVVAGYASIPLAETVSERWTAPYAEKVAANDLADMLSMPHGENGRETIASLKGLDKLVKEKPAPYTEWLSTYRVTPEEAEKAYAESAEALLITVTSGCVYGITRGATYALLTIVTMLLCSFIIRKLEWNMVEPVRRRGVSFTRVLIPVCGAVYGTLIVMQLTLCLEWVIPAVSGSSVIFTEEMLTKGTLYPFFKQINLFVQLFF